RTSLEKSKSLLNSNVEVSPIKQLIRSGPTMSIENPTRIHATGEATGFIPAPGDKRKPIAVIGTNSIRAGFDATCLQQALNARSAPGVTDLVLNPARTLAMLRQSAAFSRLRPTSIPVPADSTS